MLLAAMTSSRTVTQAQRYPQILRQQRHVCSTHGLARRVLQAAKRKIIYHLGFVSDQKFYLDSAIVRPRTDVERIMLYCDAVDIEFLLPVDGSKARNSYRPRF